MELITPKAAQQVANVTYHLPQLEVAFFVIPLARYLGLPITEEKLARLTSAELALLFTDEEKQQLKLDTETLGQISYYLQSEREREPAIPTPDAQESDISPGILQVAIASNGGEMIDGHFGSCPRFLIYQVGCDLVRLIAVRSTVLADETADKNAARTTLIRDCSILYVQSIGGPAAARIVQTGIHPIKLSQGGSARAALMRLQTALRSPPPWLAKILKVPLSSSLEQRSILT